MKLEIISKYPSGNTSSAPLLFVHGAWHAAWCWDVHFLDYFAQHGFTAQALSLRGHGNSEGCNKLHWNLISDYVDDLAEVVQQITSPPILIGHSMGALVVQKYLELHPSPAAVLMAPPPPYGLLATTIRIAMKHPLLFIKGNLMHSPHVLVSTPHLARETLFSEELAETLLLKYCSQLQEESYLAFLGMLAFNWPKPEKVKNPLLVLGGSRDTIIKPNEVKSTAKAYNAQVEFVADVAHDMMLEPQWQIVADKIITWLRKYS